MQALKHHTMKMYGGQEIKLRARIISALDGGYWEALRFHAPAILQKKDMRFSSAQNKLKQYEEKDCKQMSSCPA
jgi:hypothetical protein